MMSTETRVHVPFAYNFLTTVTQVIQFRHVWSIEKLSFCLNDGVITSPFFGSRAHDAHHCYLPLYPRGEDEESRERISIFLYFNSGSLNGLPAECYLATLNAEQETMATWLPLPSL